MQPFPFNPNELPQEPFMDGLIPIDQINQPQQMPDGSMMFNIGSNEDSGDDDKSSSETAFYANLAENLKDDKLSGIAGKLLDEIKQDQESRADWEKAVNLVYKYLGFKIEEARDVPFMRACGAFDSTLSTALLNFYSTARAELFPAAGPARSEIVGMPTPEIEDQGERVKMFMNWYLTSKDKEYYSDSERLILYTGFFGCAFRKVYQDPILNRPLARLVRPQDFIVNNNTSSLTESDRFTEVLYINKKEVYLRQQTGDFIEFDLPMMEDTADATDSPIAENIKKQEGINTDSNENKSLFKFYECHVNMDVNEVEPKKKGSKARNSKIPRPYVVTICVATRKVVSVKRNWKEGDEKFNRLDSYVDYHYLPGFGIYSLGIAHLMGSNAITLTSITRQLIDAGTLKNFPGGLRARGMRIENNDKAIGPSEWLEVETGGLPLSECIMPMPYAEPSQVLLELRNEIKQETATLVSTAEKDIPEMGSNMPVGTTLAILEVANKVQSSILRSLHVSLGRELKLLFDLFGDYLEETPYPFAVPGKDTAIMKKDFSDKVNIVPVSDPNVLTSTHRLMRNEALLKLATSAPDIHDMREAYHRMYQAMNVENIEKLLPPKPEPMPVDPGTENMLILSGKEASVKMFQEDEAHITVHQQFSNNPMVQGNPQVYASLMLHIQKHKAFKAYKELHRQKQMQTIQQHIEAQSNHIGQQMIMSGIPPEMAQMQLQQQMQAQMQQMVQQIQPPPDIAPEMEEQLIMDPEVQNMVAKQDAEDTIQQQQKAEQDAQQALDPNKVAVMEIEQRREASHLKDEGDKLKAETEAFKAQLKYESETAKTDSQREIASEKHEVDIALAQHKGAMSHHHKDLEQ